MKNNELKRRSIFVLLFLLAVFLLPTNQAFAATAEVMEVPVSPQPNYTGPSGSSVFPITVGDEVDGGGDNAIYWTFAVPDEICSEAVISGLNVSITASDALYTGSGDGLESQRWISDVIKIDTQELLQTTIVSDSGYHPSDGQMAVARGGQGDPGYSPSYATEGTISYSVTLPNLPVDEFESNYALLQYFQHYDQITFSKGSFSIEYSGCSTQTTGNSSQSQTTQTTNSVLADTGDDVDKFISAALTVSCLGIGLLLLGLIVFKRNRKLFIGKYIGLAVIFIMPLVLHGNIASAASVESTFVTDPAGQNDLLAPNIGLGSQVTSNQASTPAWETVPDPSTNGNSAFISGSNIFSTTYSYSLSGLCQAATVNTISITLPNANGDYVSGEDGAYYDLSIDNGQSISSEDKILYSDNYGGPYNLGPGVFVIPDVDNDSYVIELSPTNTTIGDVSKVILYEFRDMSHWYVDGLTRYSVDTPIITIDYDDTASACQTDSSTDDNTGGVSSDKTVSPRPALADTGDSRNKLLFEVTAYLVTTAAVALVLRLKSL